MIYYSVTYDTRSVADDLLEVHVAEWAVGSWQLAVADTIVHRNRRRCGPSRTRTMRCPHILTHPHTLTRQSAFSVDDYGDDYGGRLGATIRGDD